MVEIGKELIGFLIIPWIIWVIITLRIYLACFCHPRFASPFMLQLLVTPQSTYHVVIIYLSVHNSSFQIAPPLDLLGQLCATPMQSLYTRVIRVVTTTFVVVIVAIAIDVAVAVAVISSSSGVTVLIVVVKGSSSSSSSINSSSRSSNRTSSNKKSNHHCCSC